MAGVNTKAYCSICEEETSTFLCRGCSKDFCFNHLTEHRQTLNIQLQQIQNDYNQFRQRLIDEKRHPKRHPSIEKIDRWKKESIENIEQTAEECKRKVINFNKKILDQLEIKLNNPDTQPMSISGKNELNEIDLNKLKKQLMKLKEELNKANDLSIEQQSTTFIDKIVVCLPLDIDTTWKQNGTTIAGGNGQGDHLNQLSFPHGMSFDNQIIYIANYSNHRIVKWKCNASKGEIIPIDSENENQLSCPTDVVIDRESSSLIIADQGNRRVIRWSGQNNTNEEMLISDIDCARLTIAKNGSLYVSDWKKNEVRQWRRGEKGDGTIVAGGNGQGDQLNQLNHPTFIFVDGDNSLYVSDNGNHRVMKWLKNGTEGIVVAGGNGEGSSLRQLSSPQGVFVNLFGQIYVVDCGNDRVMHWCEGGRKGRIVVGGNGQGERSNQFNHPKDLFFDGEGNLYVVDCFNHRIQKSGVECTECPENHLTETNLNIFTRF